MEFFTIKSIVSELKQKICAAKVIEVSQPARDDLLFRLKLPEAVETLIISTSAESSRIHLTSARDGARTPLSESFKNRLIGAIIEDIDTGGFDRVIQMRMRKGQPASPELKSYILITELMGRQSNSMLVEGETGLILECMKRVDEKKSRFRKILPGVRYAPPPGHGKLEPATATPEALLELLESSGCADDFSKKAMAIYQGLGPLGSKEIYWQWSGPSGGGPDIRAAWGAFLTLTGLASDWSTEPTFYFDSESALPLYLSPIALKSLGHLPYKTFRTMNEAADAFFSLRASAQHFQRQKKRLLSCIALALGKIRSKRGAILADIEEMRARSGEKALADLIMANLKELRRGMELAILRPFGPEEAEPVRVALDPSLSPVENATLYYKRHSKAKRGLLKAQGRLQSAEQAMGEAESMLERAALAKTEADLHSLERALLDKEIIKPKVPRTEKEKNRSMPPQGGIKRFLSSDGCAIFVGQSDRANDYLFAHFKSANDIWLHAEGVPGAHVVLKARGKKAPHSELAIKEAALMAAHFSKAKGNSVTPVNYAAGKYVKKIKGAPAGRVALHNHKTIFVRLDPEEIAQIAKRRKQN